jgi:hypothetical protein
MPPTKYKVLLDDNFHYMDEDERTEHGEFESLEAAVAACRRIVDEFLLSTYTPGMSAEALYDHYTGFGTDPFIVGGEARNDFSAWDYARRRCKEICGGLTT